MKKYIVGALFGFLLSVPFTAFGEELASMIGKTVQAENPVVVNGKVLEVKSVNIDGTTYSPNRAIAEALGMDIKFEDNTVIFEEKAVPEEEPIQTDIHTEIQGGDVVSEDMTLEEINLQIESLQSSIEARENMLKITDRSEEEKEVVRQQIAEIQAKIAELEAKKAQLQAQTP